MKNYRFKIHTFLILFSLVLLSYSSPSNVNNVYSLDDDTIQTTSELQYEKDDWTWTDYELLTASSNHYSNEPHIIGDVNNDIHLVWIDFTDNLLGSGSDQDIFYQYYDHSIEAWSPIELVSTESAGSSVDPRIVIDQSGTLHVLWLDTTDYLGAGIDRDVFYKTRSPLGVWSAASVVTTTSTDYIDHLEVIIDEDDNLHVTYYDLTDNLLGSGTDSDIFYHQFNSSTSSWTTHYLISTESTSFGTANPSLAIDPVSGLLHFVYTDPTDILGSGTDNDVFFKSLDLNTLTLSSIELISDGSSMISTRSKILVKSNGEQHVFWADPTDMLGSGTDYDIYQLHRANSSTSWEGLNLVSLESTSPASTHTVIIDKADRIYIAWNDQTDILGAGSDGDIFFKFLTNSTSTWSDVQIVSTISNDTSISPTLAVDNRGFVSCVWDEYDDLVGDGVDRDLFHRRFYGTPSIPVLLPFDPATSEPGEIVVKWEYDPYVESYDIYLGLTDFTSISSLTPTATGVTSSSFNDTLHDLGTYFYGLVAHNEIGSSDLSNVESLEIIKPESFFGEFFQSLSNLSTMEILTLTGILIISHGLIAFLAVALTRKGKKKGKSKKKSSSKKKK